MRPASLLLAPALLLLGCPQPEPCVPMSAVYTDIDETLTTDDHEWLEQLFDAGHDPAMRPDAEAVMSAYAELGYAVIYVTARGEGTVLDDDRTARQATLDWLLQHGFPASDERLFLADGGGAWGDDAVDYKAGVLDRLSEDGWEAAWAYGNAETDIEAFLRAGIPSDQIFLVGELAGTMDVRPIPDEEAFAQHRADHLPTVEEASCEE